MRLGDQVLRVVIDELPCDASLHSLINIVLTVNRARDLSQSMPDIDMQACISSYERVHMLLLPQVDTLTLECVEKTLKFLPSFLERHTMWLQEDHTA